jgi:hypothetical protein
VTDLWLHICDPNHIIQGKGEKGNTGYAHSGSADLNNYMYVKRPTWGPAGRWKQVVAEDRFTLLENLYKEAEAETDRYYVN